jgi:hypothetical protein
MAGVDFAIRRDASVQASDTKANLRGKPEIMRIGERIGRIFSRIRANNSDSERNSTLSVAEFPAVDVVQQSRRNLHVPSAKNDKAVVRLPHMVRAR